MELVVRDPMALLSEGQKTCLRLVARGMSSKEIAKETGLAPQTVDTYLKTAIALLGATNRREAARMLAAWELSQKSGSPSPEVAGAESRLDDAPQIDGKAGRWLRLPPIGGGLNDLSWTQKTYQTLLVAVTGTSVVTAMALLIAGLFETFS